MARALREKALPGVFHLHFNGAGGNVAAGKYNDGSPAMRPILAQRLADGMAAAWKATVKSPLKAGAVDWRAMHLSLPVSQTIRDTQKLRDIISDPHAQTPVRTHAHSALGYRPPVEFEQPGAQPAAAVPLAAGHRRRLPSLEASSPTGAARFSR